LESTRKSHDILSKEKSDLLSKLATIEMRAKELDQNLRAGESKYRAMAILEASQQAGRAVLEKKINDATQQASSATDDKETLAVKNSELASQLALAEKSKASLKKELDAKMARLLELEQALAALSAAEHVVSTESMVSDDKTISTCTSSSTNKSGGLCLTMHSTGAAGVAANAAQRAAGVAASIARSAGIKNAWTEHHEDKGDTPGLVAIAGAVAAVWAFAVIMEKRSSLYKTK
jgi:seryl-tRNA synthetase